MTHETFTWRYMAATAAALLMPLAGAWLFGWHGAAFGVVSTVITAAAVATSHSLLP